MSNIKSHMENAFPSRFRDLLTVLKRHTAETYSRDIQSIRIHDLALQMLITDLVPQAMIVSRANEAGKKRVRGQRLRFQFGMRLCAQKPRVVGKLDHLDKFSVGRFSRKAQT